MRIIQAPHLTIHLLFLRWAGVLFLDSVGDVSDSSFTYGEDAPPGVGRVPTGQRCRGTVPRRRATTPGSSSADLLEALVRPSATAAAGRTKGGTGLSMHCLQPSRATPFHVARGTAEPARALWACRGVLRASFGQFPDQIAFTVNLGTIRLAAPESCFINDLVKEAEIYL